MGRVWQLLAAGVFLISGLAALVYQVAWQRLLVVFAGGDVGAVTIIVAAFMLGLGAGHLAGGALADRAGGARCLGWFALAELLVAVLGLSSKRVLYDWLQAGPDWLVESRSVTAAVLVALLFAPTFLMGLSLPLLARALIGGLEQAAGVTARLYGMNTLGAAAGALTATWVLLPLTGMEGAIRMAALLNGACALAVLPMLAAARASGSEPAQMPTGTERGQATLGQGEAAWGFRRWLLIYALTGFIALALEIVWFRLLGVMLKSTAFTTGTLLAIYLGGIGLGALAGAPLARRWRRPGRAFLWLQAAAGLGAGLGVALLLGAVRHWPVLAGAREYFASYEPVDANTAVLLLQKWAAGTATAAELNAVWIFPALHLALPLLLIGPPTLLMGLSFPCLQKAVQTDAARIGRRIGWLQGANIAGSVAGALLTTACLLPLLGTAHTLRLLAALAGGLGLLALGDGTQVRRRVRWVLPVAACGVVAIVWLLPRQDALWSAAHGVEPERIHFAEDASGVSAITTMEQVDPAAPPAATVFVSGIGQSWLPYGGVHSLLGALPVLLHPNPEEIAIIGLGSGDTLYCAAAREETRAIVCIEMLGAQWTTLRAHAAATGYRPLAVCLDDPRIRHVMGDGRHFLARTERRFDIIEADAVRPTSAHSGNLYSAEYFRLISSRLKPGGLAVTWNPTGRVHDTFASVFPHVLSIGPMLLGGNERPEVDLDALRWRLLSQRIREHYQLAGIEIADLMKPTFESLLHRQPTAGAVQEGRAPDVLTDVFPKDEFDLPVLWGARD